MFDFYFNIVFVLLAYKWLSVLFSWKKRTVCWATPSLRFAVRAANSPSAQTATLRPLHFVSPLNAHQNEANPMDNWELTIENYLFFSLIYQWYRFRDCRGAALLRLTTSFRTQMAINKIMNEFIMLFVVLSCRVTWRRSTLRLYSLP